MNNKVFCQTCHEEITNEEEKEYVQRLGECFRCEDLRTDAQLEMLDDEEGDFNYV